MQSLNIAVILLVAFAAYVAAAPGSIKVRNTGGYTAVFRVEFDHGGKKESRSSGDFTLGVNKAITIPDGAKNIFVKVEEYWIARQKTTVFTKSYSSAVTKCFKIWGTTLNPKYSEENC